MRLKSLNLNGRSKSYSDNQRIILEKVTNTINDLGELFDKFIELENFMMANMLNETVELIEVRENRKKIEASYGASSYIEEYFKPTAERLKIKIKDLINEWDSLYPEFTIEKITKIVSNLKEINKFIEKMNDIGLDSTNDTLLCIKGMINDFGRFKVVKSVIAANPADQINNTLKARDEILNYKNRQESTKGTSDIEDEDISIDDL